jgi:hypothetical protein
MDWTEADARLATLEREAARRGRRVREDTALARGDRWRRSEFDLKRWLGRWIGRRSASPPRSLGPALDRPALSGSGTS